MQQIPTRIAIGTQKAASTYLYNLLASHPDVALSERTEVDFYSTHFEKGTDWYQSTFPQNGTPVDISPKYFMFGEKVASRIKETLGEASPRFLIILRNPIEYLNSHFRMQWQQGFFKDNPDYPEATADLGTFVTRYPHYAARALYHKTLSELWLPHFPLNNFKVIFFEELVRPEHTARVMDGVLDFWELPQHSLHAQSVSKNQALRAPFLHGLKHTVIQHPKLKEFLKQQRWFNYLYTNLLTVRSVDALTEHDRDILRTFFASDVHQLETLLKTKIDWWKDFQ